MASFQFPVEQSSVATAEPCSFLFLKKNKNKNKKRPESVRVQWNAGASDAHVEPRAWILARASKGAPILPIILPMIISIVSLDTTAPPPGEIIKEPECPCPALPQSRQERTAVASHSSAMQALQA